MGFSFYQTYPLQGWLDRTGESPIGSPKLASQSLGQGQVVSVIGGREGVPFGQLQRTPMLISLPV